MIQTAQPSAFLSSYVKSYWMIENVMANGQEHIQRIVPTGLIELSCYLGDKPTSSDPSKSFSGHLILTGQLKNYFDIHISGSLSLFSVYFYPHGLAPFLDIPVKELQNRSVPLTYLFGKDVRQLEEQLASTHSFHQRITILEHFLGKQLKKQKQNPDDRRVAYSIRLINQTRGQIGIDHLASSVCLSRKQFERIFLRHAGTSPKQFLRIVRFQHALLRKKDSQLSSLTELAYDCGYYDQSHMISEFFNFAGKSPRAYFHEDEPFSDYFQ